jgi:cytochrome c oxidase subunit 2
MIGTITTVLFLAGFGTYELLQNGAGGGQGPNPIAVPHGKKFQVQVIGQQWQFTYRYPSLGNMESNQLVLPADTQIELHVTSLDVVHSFWAYELGIKADANPGVDNVAYLQTKGPTTFHVRCAELCGLWHGYMYNSGRVVDQAQFNSWAAQEKKVYASIAPYVNKPEDQGGAPYSHTYLPAPERRAG